MCRYTCCKNSFDEEDCFADEKRRDRAAASGLRSIPSLHRDLPCRSLWGMTLNREAENRAEGTPSVSVTEDRTTEAPHGDKVSADAVNGTQEETTPIPYG